MPELDEVLAARAGDEGAFGVLIAREARWAYGLARVVLGDQMEAEDAFQESCLLAWRDLPKLRDPARWRPWFRRLATNVILEHGRRMGRRPKVTEIVATDGPIAPDHAGRVADRDLLLQALGLLTADERILVALHYGRDLTVADAAALLGIPLGTAKARLHRAIGKMRQRVEA
ncbi:MAG TPA: RNA polymerase sigma factor [Candidatus Limnocylindrales bacterium]|nr:RNA polymerase sigma factor [Candidatus Limnocylindrales bacterium]